MIQKVFHTQEKIGTLLFICIQSDVYCVREIELRRRLSIWLERAVVASKLSIGVLPLPSYP